MTKEIVRWNEQQALGETFFKSGMFPDIKSAAQAIVKIQAGSELGLPPFASMSGIHIVSGKPTLGSNLVATLIENDPRYHYEVIASTDESCSIDFYRNDKKAGNVKITIQEAKAANMHQQWDSKENKFKEKVTWKNFPSDMLFARCITRGARRYCPGIFGGSPIYTPDELGADVDEEGFIDTTFVAQPEPQPDPQPEPHVKPERPYPATTVKKGLEQKAKTYEGKNASPKQRTLMVMLIDQVLQDDTKRHNVCKFLFGTGSSKTMTDAQVLAAIDWLDPQQDDGGAYSPTDIAAREVNNVYQAAIAEGQPALV